MAELFKVCINSALATELKAAAVESGLHPNLYATQIVESWCAERRLLRTDKDVERPASHPILPDRP
jgi:hypothetical protein